MALRTIASMGLLPHGFHKLFPAMASSKQWGLWVGFVGFMVVSFGKEEKMSFVGRRERLYIGNDCRWSVLWVKTLAMYFILESQWLKCWPTWLKYYIGKWCETLYSWLYIWLKCWPWLLSNLILTFLWVKMLVVVIINYFKILNLQLF